MSENVRPARESDPSALTAIYNYYIENTAATFHSEPSENE